MERLLSGVARTRWFKRVRPSRYGSDESGNFLPRLEGGMPALRRASPFRKALGVEIRNWRSAAICRIGQPTIMRLSPTKNGRSPLIGCPSKWALANPRLANSAPASGLSGAPQHSFRRGTDRDCRRSSPIRRLVSAAFGLTRPKRSAPPTEPHFEPSPRADRGHRSVPRRHRAEPRRCDLTSCRCRTAARQNRQHGLIEDGDVDPRRGD